MKTVVYQSFRTRDVPGFISRCLVEAKAWAALHGFDYRFYDDAFFDLIPAPLRARASAYKCLASDYARVVAARDLLASGYERAIWLDADALVFDPANFVPRATSGYSYAREVWLHRTWFGRPQFRLTVNNSLSIYCHDQTIIDHYLDSASRILASDLPLMPTTLGTDWLLNFARSTPIPLETKIGVFNPELAQHYLADTARTLRPYLNFHTSPLAALNLCLSKIDSAKNGFVFNDATALRLIDRLLSDRGASLNRHFTGEYQPTHDEFNRSHSRYLSLRDAVQSLRSALN
jgi:hypothetical protein